MTDKNELNEKLKKKAAQAKTDDTEAAVRAMDFEAHHTQVLADIQTWCQGLHGITVSKPEHFPAPKADGVSGAVRLFAVQIKSEGNSAALHIRGSSYNYIKFSADGEVAHLSLTRKGDHAFMILREHQRGKAPPRQASDLHEWNESGFMALIERWTRV